MVFFKLVYDIYCCFNICPVFNKFLKRESSNYIFQLFITSFKGTVYRLFLFIVKAVFLFVAPWAYCKKMFHFGGSTEIESVTFVVSWFLSWIQSFLSFEVEGIFHVISRSVVY